MQGAAACLTSAAEMQGLLALTVDVDVRGSAAKELTAMRTAGMVKKLLRWLSGCEGRHGSTLRNASPPPSAARLTATPRTIARTHATFILSESCVPGPSRLCLHEQGGVEAKRRGHLVQFARALDVTHPSERESQQRRETRV